MHTFDMILFKLQPTLPPTSAKQQTFPWCIPRLLKLSLANTIPVSLLDHGTERKMERKMAGWFPSKKRVLTYIKWKHSIIERLNRSTSQQPLKPPKMQNWTVFVQPLKSEVFFVHHPKTDSFKRNIAEVICRLFIWCSFQSSPKKKNNISKKKTTVHSWDLAMFSLWSQKKNKQISMLGCPWKLVKIYLVSWLISPTWGM